jgi:hypothetical protein
MRDFSDVHADIEGNYFNVPEAAAPGLAEQVHNGKRGGRWIGGAIENFSESRMAQAGRWSGMPAIRKTRERLQGSRTLSATRNY